MRFVYFCWGVLFFTDQQNMRFVAFVGCLIFVSANKCRVICILLVISLVGHPNKHEMMQILLGWDFFALPIN